eukprot:g1522.t1
MLHYVEFAALSVTFVTFWGGMIFYLDSDIVDEKARIFMTVLIVCGNVVFVVAALCLYAKQVMKDMRKNKMRQLHGTGSRKSDDNKSEDCENTSSFVQVVPAGGGLTRTSSTVLKASRLQTEHLEHEKRLVEGVQRESEKHRRRTHLRLRARMMLRQSKALQKVEIFHDLHDSAISALVEQMEYSSCVRDAVVVRENEVADTLFVIIKGKCGVYRKSEMGLSRESVGTHGLKLGSLHDFDVFGEAALVDRPERRNATVVVESEKLDMLKLSRSAFFDLVSSGKLSGHAASVLERTRSVRSARVERNKSVAMGGGARTLGRGGSGVGVVQPGAPPGPPPSELDSEVVSLGGSALD